jgi:hypothetical protein
MGSVSIWHWVVVLLVLMTGPVSLVAGIVRGVTNRSVLNALLSVLIPAYGLVYYLVARSRPPALPAQSS